MVPTPGEVAQAYGIASTDCAAAPNNRTVTALAAQRAPIESPNLQICQCSARQDEGGEVIGSAAAVKSGTDIDQ